MKEDKCVLISLYYHTEVCIILYNAIVFVNGF